MEENNYSYENAYERFATFESLISEIQRSYQRLKTREMTRLGLKSSHVMILFMLGKEQEGASATELCELCKADKAAISRALSELIKNEYIFTENQDHKRAYRSKYFLTKKGKSVVKFINGYVKEVMEGLDGFMDEEQRAFFYESLFKISEKIKEIAE